MNDKFVFFFCLFSNLMFNQLEILTDTTWLKYLIKLETKIANLSTWFANFTRCRTEKPHVFVNFASFFRGSFAVVPAVIVKAVILAGSTVITRTCACRFHKWLPFAIVFRNDILAKFGILVYTTTTS